ncbi:Hypothetical predicted protein [Mytilus galloprovincialis]|uniref:B box-type domain-containing protein n=1 Tax=Mytilus galloprovincialis TaxID=29158 RepID=A0A8B6H0L6_MYTGA|nr:Hypothetical predicted protein [Mytilus galloprovincialis]
MALSRSVQKAQSTAACPLCEQTTNLKWKCNECDLLFCDNCHPMNLKLHSKSKLLKYHVIIDIKDLGQNEETKCIQMAQLGNIFCAKHLKQKCSLFCNKCAVQICNTCIIENSHRDHALNEISDVYDKKMKILNDMKNETEDEIDKCNEEEKRIKSMFNDGQSNYKDTLKAISQREDALVDILKKHSKFLEENIKTEWRTTEKAFICRQTEVEEHRRKLERKRDSINQTLPLQQVLEILKTTRTPCEKLETRKYIYQMKLQQSKVNMCLKDVETSLQNVFGALDSGPKYEFQHVLKPDLKDLSKFLCYEKDRMIFSSVTEALLQQVKIENNDIVVEKQHNGIKVYDMALMKNGKVLLSMKSSKLNIWDCEGKLGLFQSFNTFDTYGICVGKENEILVGLSSSNVVNELDTSGKVLVLNAEKQVVKTYEHDKKTKQKLFKCPLKIVINYEKSICVIDVDNNMRDDGRVLCLNPEGTLNWKYKGSNSRIFKPYDLATNSEGLMFVLDTSGMIHCVNQEGIGTTYTVFYTEGTSHLPFCGTLAIDSEGLLLVGHTDGYNRNSKITVYQLK